MRSSLFTIPIRHIVCRDNNSRRINEVSVYFWLSNVCFKLVQIHDFRLPGSVTLTKFPPSGPWGRRGRNGVKPNIAWWILCLFILYKCIYKIIFITFNEHKITNEKRFRRWQNDVSSIEALGIRRERKESSL